MSEFNQPGSGNVDLKKSRRKTERIVNPMKIDRIPPHDDESEKGVLGCMLMSPRECIAEAIEFFSGIPRIEDVFYTIKHQALWTALTTMFEKGHVIDNITLQGYLKSSNQLEAVGGFVYASSLQDDIPSSANMPYYLQTVKEKFILRQLIQTCTEIVGRAFEHENEVNELVGEAESEITRVGDMLVSCKEKTIREHVHDAISELERDIEFQGEPSGIKYGFPDLDRLLTGAQNGEMTVIAARPGTGKTAIGLNIVESAAIDHNIPVGFFSLEMRGPKLAKRMLASRARVNLRKMTDGYIAERSFPKLTAAAGKISHAPIHIVDRSTLTILEFKAKARRMVKRGMKLIVIDYLQLMTSNSMQARTNRQQEVSDISKGIKQIALELDIPIIVLAQLNRDIEKQKGRKPMLADLRESGSIEQDADNVLLLYKILKDGDDDEPQGGLDAEPFEVGVLVAKARNGPTGEVVLMFVPQETRFMAPPKIDKNDVQRDSEPEPVKKTDPPPAPMKQDDFLPEPPED